MAYSARPNMVLFSMNDTMAHSAIRNSTIADSVKRMPLAGSALSKMYSLPKVFMPSGRVDVISFSFKRPIDMPVKKVWVPRVTIIVFSLKLEMIQPFSMPSTQPMATASAKPASGFVAHQPLFRQIVVASE